jgi:hypothetical protein
MARGRNDFEGLLWHGSGVGSAAAAGYELTDGKLVYTGRPPPSRYINSHAVLRFSGGCVS